MNRISSNSWQTFKISDIFVTQNKGNRLQVPTGSYVDKTNLIDGNIPRITVTNNNNGIFGYYDVKKQDSNYRVFENFISVSFLGTVFYHKNQASLDMKVHCLKPKDFVLNKYVGEFLVAVILASLRESSYSDQISSTLLPNLDIKLPIYTNGSPNWEYMETYMKNIEEKTNKHIESISQILEINSNKIDTKNWKKFHLYDNDLFDIDMGTKLDKVKMTEKNPTINFVGRANANNGITTCVDYIDGIEPYKAGSMTISLGGEYLGSCFVQPKHFYTSQNVIVLLPKNDMSFNVKQFIATMIYKESRTHYKAFIEELNKHIKTDFSFYLPVDSNGNPDWEYMESFMKNVKNSIDNKLLSFNSL